eukprot:7386379-Prymnesium_polylepis.1
MSCASSAAARAWAAPRSSMAGVRMARTDQQSCTTSSGSTRHALRRPLASRPIREASRHSVAPSTSTARGKGVEIVSRSSARRIAASSTRPMFRAASIMCGVPAASTLPKA